MIYKVITLKDKLNLANIWRAPSGHQAGSEAKSEGRTWPQKPLNGELRGLQVEDLDLDGTCEIIVSAATGSKVNTWAYEHNGSLRNGWPQLSNYQGYAWGVYNNNASIGNISGDSRLEVVVPSDVHYICAYNDAGKSLKANSLYGNKFWGQVGVWEEDFNWPYKVYDSSKKCYEFSSVPAVVDLNQNGNKEVIVSTWTGKSSGKNGSVMIINYKGYEIVVNSVNSGFIAYDVKH